MDFTDLEDAVSEAKLDYTEAESLLRFFNFRREQEGETPIDIDHYRLCEQLSQIHSDVTFEPADHRIVARVNNGVSGSLVERIGFVSPQVPHLATTIAFDSDTFHVVFRADRIGVIKEDSWYEFFEHDLDLEEVRRDCENDEDSINDFLRDHFNEQISQQMEDPFFDPSGADCELYFETGTQGELERLIKLFILTEPDIEAHEDEEVRLYAAADGTDPYLEDNDSYYSQRLDNLAKIALSENRPVGWSFEYNDGAYNRRSGYYEQPESFSWEISEVLEESSSREKMAARRELRKWLEARGLDPALFAASAERRVPA